MARGTDFVRDIDSVLTRDEPLQRFPIPFVAAYASAPGARWQERRHRLHAEQCCRQLYCRPSAPMRWTKRDELPADSPCNSCPTRLAWQASGVRQASLAPHHRLAKTASESARSVRRLSGYGVRGLPFIAPTQPTSSCGLAGRLYLQPLR